MKNLKTFEEYAVPKFAVKPAANDTGFELTRKKYKRMLWSNPELGKNGKIDASK